MRISHFLLIISLLVCSACDNDDYPHAKIPSVILNAFWAEFPSATDVDFRKVGENYEVEFEIEEKDAQALLALPGLVLKVKKEISFSELPAAVQWSLRGIGENKIDDPEIINTVDNIYYQARVKRFWSDKKLVLDKKGREDLKLDYWD